MKKLRVYSIDGTVVGEEQMPEGYLDRPANRDVLYQYVVAFCRNQRIGTASTKNRGDVSGSNRKPWRQKGTGRARVGSTRNPIWRHGGTAFGPKPREYYCRIPRQMRRRALAEALRDKFSEDRVGILRVEPISAPKTRLFADFIGRVSGTGEKFLFILDRRREDRNNILRSLRNIRNVEWVYDGSVNAYELLNTDRVILLGDLLAVMAGHCVGGDDVRAGV